MGQVISRRQYINRERDEILRTILSARYGRTEQSPERVCHTQTVADTTAPKKPNWTIGRMLARSPTSHFAVLDLLL